MAGLPFNSSRDGAPLKDSRVADREDPSREPGRDRVARRGMALNVGMSVREVRDALVVLGEGNNADE